MKTPSRARWWVSHRSCLLKLPVLLPVTAMAVLMCLNIYQEVTTDRWGIPRKLSYQVRTVCGKFRGTVISVSSDYITSFAEYHDSELPEEKRIRLRQNCESDFWSLPMAITWPDMAPGGSEYFRSTSLFDGFGISLDSHVLPTPLVLKWNLENYLKKSNELYEANAGYYPALDMHGVTENLGFKRAADSIFWSERDGEIQVIFECSIVYSREDIFGCRGTFLIPEIPVRAEIVIPRDRLSEWKAMLASAKQFVISQTEKKGLTNE